MEACEVCQLSSSRMVRFSLSQVLVSLLQSSRCETFCEMQHNTMKEAGHRTCLFVIDESYLLYLFPPHRMFHHHCQQNPHHQPVLHQGTHHSRNATERRRGD